MASLPNNQAAFEVRVGGEGAVFRETYKVWKHGGVEGFGKDGERVIVFNRIPLLMALAEDEGFDLGRSNPDIVIYDIGQDGERLATQQDIDHLVAARRAYDKCRERGLVPDDIHQELQGAVAAKAK